MVATRAYGDCVQSLVGRKVRRRPRAAASGSGAAERSLRVTVDALEIGKGYDGPLKKNAACFAMSYPANTITRVTVTLK